MNSARSNVKVKGQMNSEFDEYPQKADERRNSMKPKSNDLELQLERYPIFKISKILDKNWVKLKTTKN